MTFNDHLIPIEVGQAVSRGWTSITAFQPVGVIWHWTASRDLASARATLGGAQAERKGEASAHFCVGRTHADGIDRYVDIANRSWHAGINQTLTWAGAPSTRSTTATRTMIGIETVNVGYERAGITASAGWIDSASPNGKQTMRVQPWSSEQIEMMIELGKYIVAANPQIRPEHHLGHHDICPGYKLDVSGFPMASVLRGVYDDPSIPDVWSPFWTVRARQQALVQLKYDIGKSGIDGDWGRMCDAALRKFQRDFHMVEDGMWTTFVSRRVWKLLNG